MFWAILQNLEPADFLFFLSDRSIATRLYYLPKNPNDTKTTWPRPDMEGKLNLINSSLRSINRKLANQQIRKLHEVGLTGVTPKSEQHTVLDILGNAWASANKRTLYLPVILIYIDVHCSLKFFLTFTIFSLFQMCPVNILMQPFRHGIQIMYHRKGNFASSFLAC